MRKIILLGLMIVNTFAWEINTHRAIDRMALKSVTRGASGGVLSAPSSTKNKSNLETFVDNAGIKNTTYSSEKFEGYGSGMTYKEYLINGEKE